MMRSVAVLLGAMMLHARPPVADLVVDDFETVSAWKAMPSDGVDLKIGQDAGVRGKSMRIDFDFHGHGGYGVVRRNVDLSLPANYEFSFTIRGDAPVNTLEFKLVDPTGDNVWWSNQPGFVFPKTWQTIVRKKRHITFAWGPIGGGEMKRVAAIEIAITAGTGGKGTVWLDDLKLTPLEPPGPYTLKPAVTAGSSTPRFAASNAIDGNPATVWRIVPASTSGDTYLDIDFLKRREFGGLVIDWEANARPSSYTVSTSIDGAAWTQVHRAGSSVAARDYLYLPETDARHLRVAVRASTDRKVPHVGLKEITVKPLAWSATKNDFLTAVARDAPRGSYPRYFSGKQSYWTVVGVNGDTREGLFDTRGMLETGKAQFSIEPFVRTSGRLISWADVPAIASAADTALPIPSVTWRASPLELTVTAFATGKREASILFGRYRIRNTGAVARTAKLYLALRPFQVNPPWQFLNTSGGAAAIDSVSFDGRRVKVNTSRIVFPVTTPSGFGAMSFDQGSIVDILRTGSVPESQTASDRLGLASAVLSYDIRLRPQQDTVVYVAVPLHDSQPDCAALSRCTSQWAESQLDSSKAMWRRELGGVHVRLPRSASRISESLRSNLAYILINRDGPAIQPGSRSYERSWIRDGSLTSTALLRLGHADEVREFLLWFAGYQFENGKVPCCVDARGSDPVPENDSHGEFIYLAAEYFRHTGDRATLERVWPNVSRAYGFMDSLRLSRKTSEYRTPEKLVFYGLLPQSISHEGYSAKPMHSYWDDFFALRGFRDAAEIARTLGRREAGAYEKVRDEFQADLYRSIERAMQIHKIDYIPGAAELGDFDATSTTIAVNPGGELGGPLQPALERTFAKYYEEFRQRRDGIKTWEIYTPYEWRVVGTLVRMGQRKRAHELVDFFFEGQRPKEWHQWAEVVWRKQDTAQFIGDMPHTWVGSDYIRSVLDMFAYERESDSALVVGAGLPESWIREENGAHITGLSTHYGRLDYSMHAKGATVEVRIGGTLRVPRGGIVIKSPITGIPRSVTVNGATAAAATEFRIRSVPAVVVMRY